MTLPVPSDAQQRRRTPAVSKRAREVFLECLAAGFSVTHAAREAGVTKTRFYENRRTDETFASAWAEAERSGTDAMEDEARRRAVDGVPEPVYQGGKLVGTVQRYDSSLLMFLLKKRDPAAFREGTRVELTGAGGGAIELTAAGYQPPTLADVVRVAAETGVLATLGYSAVEVIDGDAVEAEPAELGPGEPS